MIDFSDPQIVNAYDELPLWSAMFGLVLLDEVPLANVRVALDVGCGTGFPLIELAERLGSSAQVHGIDPWRAALDRAAAKIAARRTPNVTLHEGSAAQMPFDDGTFDLIVSNLGVNNFDDRAAAMRECRRVARPGARRRHACASRMARRCSTITSSSSGFSTPGRKSPTRMSSHCSSGG